MQISSIAFTPLFAIVHSSWENMSVRFSLAKATSFRPWSKKTSTESDIFTGHHMHADTRPASITRLHSSPERLRADSSGSGYLDRVPENGSVEFDGRDEEENINEIDEEFESQGLYRGIISLLMRPHTEDWSSVVVYWFRIIQKTIGFVRICSLVFCGVLCSSSTTPDLGVPASDNTRIPFCTAVSLSRTLRIGGSLVFIVSAENAHIQSFRLNMHQLLAISWGLSNSAINGGTRNPFSFLSPSRNTYSRYSSLPRLRQSHLARSSLQTCLVGFLRLGCGGGNCRYQTRIREYRVISWCSSPWCPRGWTDYRNWGPRYQTRANLWRYRPNYLHCWTFSSSSRGWLQWTYISYSECASERPCHHCNFRCRCFLELGACAVITTARVEGVEYRPRNLTRVTGRRRHRPANGCKSARRTREILRYTFHRTFHCCWKNHHAEQWITSGYLPLYLAYSAPMPFYFH